MNPKACFTRREFVVQSLGAAASLAGTSYGRGAIAAPGSLLNVSRSVCGASAWAGEYAPWYRWLSGGRVAYVNRGMQLMLKGLDGIENVQQAHTKAIGRLADLASNYTGIEGVPRLFDWLEVSPARDMVIWSPYAGRVWQEGGSDLAGASIDKGICLARWSSDGKCWAGVRTPVGRQAPSELVVHRLDGRSRSLRLERRLDVADGVDMIGNPVEDRGRVRLHLFGAGDGAVRVQEILMPGRGDVMQVQSWGFDYPSGYLARGVEWIAPSPGGHQIILKLSGTASDGTGHQSLFCCNIDGSKMLNLGSVPDGSAATKDQILSGVRWLPNEKEFSYIHDGKLWIGNLA